MEHKQISTRWIMGCGHLSPFHGECSKVYIFIFSYVLSDIPARSVMQKAISASVSEEMY